MLAPPVPKSNTNTLFTRLVKQFIAEIKTFNVRNWFIAIVTALAGLGYKNETGTLSATDAWSVILPGVWVICVVFISNVVIAGIHLRREEIEAWANYTSPIAILGAAPARRKPKLWPILATVVISCAVFVGSGVGVTVVGRMRSRPVQDVVREVSVPPPFEIPVRHLGVIQASVGQHDATTEGPMDISQCQTTVDSARHAISFVMTMTNHSENGREVHLGAVPVVDRRVFDSPAKHTDQLLSPHESMELGSNETLTVIPNDAVWKDLMKGRGRVGWNFSVEYADGTAKKKYSVNLTTDRVANGQCNQSADSSVPANVQQAAPPQAESKTKSPTGDPVGQSLLVRFAEEKVRHRAVLEKGFFLNLTLSHLVTDYNSMPVSDPARVPLNTEIQSRVQEQNKWRDDKAQEEAVFNGILTEVKTHFRLTSSLQQQLDLVSKPFIFDVPSPSSPQPVAERQQWLQQQMDVFKTRLDEESMQPANKLESMLTAILANK